ncbi:MAG: glutamyl-tRNA reductase, partial [Saprospiraceae bacterium]|nr:glutamyl-tRNA reductase [Saprospiraceae bacterium]
MLSNGLYVNQIEDFTVVGINYRKSAADVRGHYTINEEQYKIILDIAPALGLNDFFVLSTCNRTEIYGCVHHIELFVQLILSQSTGSEVAFRQMFYVKRGASAIKHFFEVGSGLDSQILGDYEIVGQIKKAVQSSKKRGLISSFTERLFNYMMQASKSIKNNTGLSDGTVSVSYSVVQYIKENVDGYADKNILLVGTGDIGRSTCQNLVEYLETHNITLVNRTIEKAALLAKELNLNYATYDLLKEELQKADIIIVSSANGNVTIKKEDLNASASKLIIDLSIPFSVEAKVSDLPNVTLVNVDELSSVTNQTMMQRAAEIPKAQEIIESSKAEFFKWYEVRKQTSVLNEV